MNTNTLNYNKVKLSVLRNKELGWLNETTGVVYLTRKQAYTQRKAGQRITAVQFAGANDNWGSAYKGWITVIESSGVVVSEKRKDARKLKKLHHPSKAIVMRMYAG